MRPLPEAAAAAQYLYHLSPPLSSSQTPPPYDAQSRRWRPYNNSKDFETNMITILIVLFCALICALALNTAIRCCLRRHPPPGRGLPQQEVLERKPTLNSAAASLAGAPVRVYSAGMKLAGAEAECAICLSEFEEGEGIRVLEKCKHGFHVQCIEKWLSSHSSCPTCRCNCLPPPSPSEETADRCRGNGIDNNSELAVDQGAV